MSETFLTSSLKYPYSCFVLMVPETWGLELAPDPVLTHIFRTP